MESTEKKQWSDSTQSQAVNALKFYYEKVLLERDTDLRYIQELLGHNSKKTTETYMHITPNSKEKLGSPLDFLDIEEES